MDPIALAFLVAGFLIGLAAGVIFARSKYRSAAGLHVNQLADSERRIEELRVEVASKESLLAEVQQQLGSERERRAKLEGENKMLETLQSELDLRNDRLEELRAKLELKTAECSGAEEKARRVPILERTLGEVEHRIRELHESSAQLREQLKAEEERTATFEEMRQSLTNHFALLSQEALKKSNESFLHLAEQKFQHLQNTAKNDLDARQKTISDHLLPIRESLAKVEKLSHDIEEKRTSAFMSLETQIKGLTETERFLHRETSLLVKALREPVTRGHYGEKLLRQVLDMAGMLEHVHYDEQVSFYRGSDLLRADLVVNLSDGQKIVIDAKAPLAPHLEVVAAASEQEREEKLRQLAQAIRTYAKDLQSKEYWKHFEPSPGIMIMFVAPESALTSAMQFDASLWDDCIRRRVLLASPTTLIALLFTVGFGWRQVEFTRNAEEIRKIGQELYERLSIFGEHLLDLGKSLTRTQDKYNQALGSLDGNVFPSARRMKELGVPTGNREIPEVPTISIEQKPIRSRELIAAGAANDTNGRRTSTQNQIAAGPVDPLFAGLSED